LHLFGTIFAYTNLEDLTIRVRCLWLAYQGQVKNRSLAIKVLGIHQTILWL